MQTVTFTLITNHTTESLPVNASDFLSSGSYERYSSTLTLNNSRGEQNVEFLTIQENGLVLLVPLDLKKTLQGYDIQFTGTAESTFEKIQ